MIRSHPLPSGFDLLALHRYRPGRYPVLLESTASGTRQGRWDMLLVASGVSLQLDPDGLTRDEQGVVVEGTFLQALDAVWQRQRLPVSPAGPGPFRGGWALLLDYEVAAQIEPVLRLPVAESGLPRALALRCPLGVLRDHDTGECWLVAEPDSEALVASVFDDIAVSSSLDSLPRWTEPVAVGEDDGAHFVAAVERVQAYLAAGDIFQANISRQWWARFPRTIEAAELHLRLRSANPGPFAGLFVSHGRAVVSSSPERLVSVADGCVQTRPIAGTRPRFEGDDQAARVRELVGHPKERAEHVMLLDLERNDLGRVSEPGSVEVDELMTVESYAHVHHIVSNVRGRLRADATPGEVIAATFPGGTITGCPKVRCMQIIGEQEGVARGAYTGAMGWLNRDGDMDLNILIRSAEVSGDRLWFRTGAGIVVDSVPERELEETRAKARGLLRALGA